MKNKDMRRVARKLWRENWFTIFLSYIAGLLGFVLLTMLFSSLLNPFILFTGDFSLGELRRGIGLSLTGILFALYVFVCVFYFIVLGFSFRKMLLDMSRGEKKVNAAMIFYGFHPNSFPLLGRMLGFSILAFLFSAVISLGQEVIDYFFGEGLIYWSYYGLSLVILIFFSLFFDMTFFTIWDGEGKSLWQNMKKSAGVMKGQKFLYFRQILYFTLVTSVAGFIAVMWSFILRSPALPIFVLFLYLSIYLIPYLGFVQTLIYRKGAGDFSTISSARREAISPEQERDSEAASIEQPTTVEAASIEQPTTVEAPSIEEPVTVETPSTEQPLAEEVPSTEQAKENEGGFSVVISEDQEERSLSGLSDTAVEGTEADAESKQDPNHKMSFEEARRQYTDYEE